MARVYVGIGSNIDKHIHVPKVIEELRHRFGELKISPVYQTKATGFDGEDFYNLVVGFSTELSPQEIYTTLRAIEAEHQRARNSVNQFVSRTLDLDQLLYDDLQVDDGRIIIPSPDILEYAFVLKPLVDIAAELIHPTLHLSMQELWQQFDHEAVVLTKIDLKILEQN